MKQCILILSIITGGLSILTAQQNSSINAQSGHDYMRNGEFDKARDVFLQLHVESQQTDSILYYGALYLDALARAGKSAKVDSSIQVFDEFVSEHKVSDNMRSFYLYKKGWIYSRSQNNEKAILIADSAVDIARSNLMRSLALSLKGSVLCMMEDQAKGLETLLEAERLMEEIGYRGKDYGVTLINIGNAYATMNDNLKSRDYFIGGYQVLLDYFKEGHPNHYIIKLFYSRELTQRNDFEKSDELLKNCLSHFEKKDDINSMIHCYHNLTDNSLKAGDFEKALNYLEINLGISKQTNRDTTYNHAVLLHSIISCLRDLGRTKAAWRRLQELEEMCGTYPRINQWLYKDMLASKALLLSDQAEYKSADSIYQKIEKHLLEKYGRRSEPMANHYFARSENYLAAKDYERAMKYHDLAAEYYSGHYDSLDHKNINMLVHKGKIMESSGALDKAGNYYLNAKDRFDVAFGKVLSSGETSSDFQSVKGRDEVYVSLLRVAAAKSMQHKLKEEWFDMAIQWLEEAKIYYNFLVRELFHVENSDHLIRQFHDIGTYGQLLYHDRYIEEGSSNLLYEALSLAEMTKNYARRIILNDKEAKKYANIPDSLLEVDHIFNRRIQYYESLLHENYNENIVYLLNKLKNEREQFIEVLEKNYPAYYRMKYDFHTASGKDIQEYAIMKDMDILYYYIGADRMFSYLVNEHGIKLSLIENADQIEALIPKFRWSMLHSNIDSFTESGNQLYELLYAPLKDEMQNSKLCIVPDQSLAYMNFETLPSPSTEPVYSFRDHHYLIEDHQILYRFEITSVSKNLKNKEQEGHICQKGNAFVPVFDAPQYSQSYVVPLPWSKSLADYIEGYDNMEVYLGAEATKQNFLTESKNSDLLHLSTHAFTNDELPMRSYMLFSGQGQQLDSLTALEIIQRDLNSKLALLSACQTGLSEYKVGFGLQSLSWSFEYAGCDNLLVSLWSIDDEASSDLLVSFYEHLDGAHSTTEALQLAKLGLLKNANVQTANPYYWAGMIYIGEDMNLVLESTTSNYYLLAIIPVALVILLIVNRKRVNA